MVYVAFWVGVPFASLFLGNVFGVISPWRALGRGVGWVAARFTDELPEPLDYPERLGRIPPRRALRLRDLRAVLGTRDRARAAGDPDAPLLRRDARRDEPLRRRGVDAQRGRVRRPLRPDRPARAARPPRRTGRLYLRVPVHRRGAARRRSPGRWRCWSISIGSTAFDGAKEGALFNDLAQDLQRFFNDLGFSLGLRSSWLSSSGWRPRCDRRGDLGARHGRDEAAAERALAARRSRAPSATR